MTGKSRERIVRQLRQGPLRLGEGQMQTFRSAVRALVPLLLLLCCGCLNVERDSYPAEWLQPASIDALKQLEGRYTNSGEKTFSGHSDTSLGNLWYFLTRQNTEFCSGDTVQITLLSPGELLVELANEAGEARQSATLSEGTDVKMMDAIMRLRPHSEADSGSFGMGVGTETCRLRLAEGGGLVGETDGIATGLLLYAIPIVGVGRDWIFWAQVEEDVSKGDKDKD